MAERENGRRVLNEVEETNLEEVLSALRVSLRSTSRNPPSSPSAPGQNNAAPYPSKVKTYPIPPLDALVTRRFRATQSAPLSLSGRQLPLIYLLVSTLVAAPCSKAVVVIDVEAKFDTTRLLQTTPYWSATAAATERTIPTEDSPSGHDFLHQRNWVSCDAPADYVPGAAEAQSITLEDLKHVHVYRPARGSPSHLREVLASAEQYMIYAKHASSAREWWGTIIIGGGSPAMFGTGNVDVTTGWRGWLRVDRDEIRGFPLGMCIEEALAERDHRQRVVEDAGYTASCQWGWFIFSDGSD